MPTDLRALSLLLYVLGFSAKAVAVVEDRGNSAVGLTPDSNAGGEAVAVNAAAFVDASGRQFGDRHANTGLMRSEKNEKKGPETSDANMLRMLQERRQQQEEEAAAEFESAFDGKWINMVGKTASQSSTMHGGDAGRALDGNSNSAWTGGSCTHTKYDYLAWWEVEMGKPFHISAVKVTNRGDCCGEQCNICTPMDLMVDESICHGQVIFAHGETKEIGCPYVGGAVRLSFGNHQDYMMLCEVVVKGVPQSFLEIGAVQCEKHGVALFEIVTSNHTDGRCVAGEPSFGSSSDAASGFQEELVGSGSTSSKTLQATSDECKEQLLNSDELVEGAVWQQFGSTGICRLLKGRKVKGAEPAAGTKCFKKVPCPHDLSSWKKRAGIGLHGGQKWG